MKKPLTTREEQILDFIREFRRKNSYSPTREEIAEHFGFYKNAATDHLKSLERKGFVKIIPKVSRGLILTKKRIQHEPERRNN
jgi:repressor LexA